jgi:hypothetical protein
MQGPDPLRSFTAAPVLEGLHGFQRDAAEYAYHRLFEASGSTGRFLIADEVGLGKTIIAKAVLAKALERLKDKVERIDVIYICSNLSIAGQNIARLNPVKGLKFASAERITLLPINMKALEERRVNFVAFTPNTSLDMGQQMGTAQERYLLYAMLRRHWELRGAAPLNVLQGAVRSAQRFREGVEWFIQNETISEELSAAFCAALDRNSKLRQQFEEVCGRFPRERANENIPQEDWTARSAIVGALRATLAETCIDALEPDLVILDEFQRFKALLTPDSEAGELASKLFQWQSAQGPEKAHVLLLSATPYKAYTLQHEIAEENHYEDFLRTVEFLDGQAGTKALRDLLENYRRLLLGLRDGALEPLLACKSAIEAHLRRVMSRTERLSAGQAANGMLRVLVQEDLPVKAPDLRAYVAVRKLCDSMEVGDAIEYWKSAPYPMNFMDGYELKRTLDQSLDTHPPTAEVLTALDECCRSALPFDRVAAYEPLGEAPNARFRQLLSQLDSAGAFDVLWLPPSLPYFALGGSFPKARQLTKRLVFSAWHLVPRSLAVLLSYECERRLMRADDPGAVNTAEARKNRGNLLRIGETEGRLTGMPLFTLLYPSATLARICDPRSLSGFLGPEAPTAAVLEAAKAAVRAQLPRDIQFAEAGRVTDEQLQWYWLAPMLMDMSSGDLAAWWESAGLAERWQGDEPDDEETAGVSWLAHIEQAKAAALAGNWPAGKAPHDLVEVLASMGLAGPATCALRSLLGLYEVAEGADMRTALDAAARVGWAFRSLYNRPESIALVRAGRSEPYWKRCLEYGMEGCLAAVLDEYLHVLRDSEGQTTSGSAEAFEAVGKAALNALTVKAASLEIDHFSCDPRQGTAMAEKRSMRSLFAMRFGSEKTDDQKQVQRDSSVKAAFNSPFWPFVLATTSVGQEGLDFHWYCHAVVHWNLPSNPVDLEQREGRVHRFKGHAVRKNVAQVFGAPVLSEGGSDLWSRLFKRASRESSAEGKGLVPYWMYPIEDGAWVERHVFMYPFSRDEVRYRVLQRSLGAYRLVFGQPRQDELLAYLVNHIPEAKLKEVAGALRIDLAP